MVENFMRFKFYAIKPLVDEKKKIIIHAPSYESYWEYILSRKTINQVKDRMLELYKLNKDRHL